MKSIANIPAFALTSELLREGKTVHIRVQGQSMLPFFRSGSVICLRPMQPKDFKRGNVVLGQTDEGHFVVHRIIEVGKNRITLLGDGNTIGTESILRERVHGIVDCGRLHLFLARMWLWMRPVRKYPLWFLKRICKK